MARLSETERQLNKRKREALTIARQARYPKKVLDRIKSATRDIEVNWALAEGRHAL